MLTFLVWLFALLPSLALLYFSAEVLCGLRPLPSPQADGAELNLAVIIPAHNEEVLIAATLEALQPRLGRRRLR